MKKQVETLLKLATQEEQAELTILYNASVANANAYKQDSSAGNLKNWKESKAALSSLVDDLIQKYTEPAVQATAFQPTSSQLDVHRWLLANGWQISQSGFYKHCKEGKLTKTDGQFTERAVVNYAKTWLRRTDTGKTMADDDAALNREKLQEEINLKRVQAKREQLKFDIERGKYIERDAFELELAGRAVALEAGFDHMVYTRAAEWIALVLGDQSRADQLIAALLEAKNTMFDSYAAPGAEFEVTLKQNHDQAGETT